MTARLGNGKRSGSAAARGRGHPASSDLLRLGAEGQTADNPRSRPELVINLPGPRQWPAVEPLAPLTGRSPVPPGKRAVLRFEPDKFAAAGLRPGWPSARSSRRPAPPGSGPGRRGPPIYSFRHCFGLGPELGHSFRWQTPH